MWSAENYVQYIKQIERNPQNLFIGGPKQVHTKSMYTNNYFLDTWFKSSLNYFIQFKLYKYKLLILQISVNYKYSTLNRISKLFVYKL